MAGVLGAEPNETDEVVWPAVASHSAAAYLWGIYRFEPGTIHVTAPIRRRAKRAFVVHFSSILREEDRCERDGIPVTALPRTLLDLAIRSHPDRLDRLLERAEELGLFDLRAFEGLLARAGGHRGRGLLASALAIYRPDPAFTRSKFEKAFRRAVIAGGLRAPSMNYVVDGFELDAYWPELRFAVELDLFETHGSRAAFERDHLRQEELKLAGIEMIRVTGPRFKREPGRVIARLATLLERRRRELTRLPPVARKTASGDEAAAVAAAIAQFEAEFPGTAAEEAPPTTAWQRAALLEGVGGKETIQDLQGGSRWLS